MNSKPLHKEKISHHFPRCSSLFSSSRPHRLPFSSSASLSHCDCLPLSLRRLSAVHRDSGSNGYIHQRRRFRWHRLFRGQLYGGQFAAVVARAAYIAKPWLLYIVLSSLASRTAGSGSQHTHLDLFFKMVPSVLDESAQIISTLFCAKMKNFSIGS